MNNCRICSREQTELISFHEKVEGSSPYDKLLQISNIDVPADGLLFICSQCLEELNTTVKFLEKCEKSNLLLASRHSQPIEALSVKTELQDFNIGSFLEPLDSTSVQLPENFFEAIDKMSEDVKCAKRNFSSPTTQNCSNSYSEKVVLSKSHSKTPDTRHPIQQIYACPTCGALMMTQWLAQQHCSKQRRPCPVLDSGNSFTKNIKLESNSRVQKVKGCRPHQCLECGKSFKTKHILNKHLEIHTGANPYECPVCGKKFTTNRLTLHLRKHGKEAELHVN